MNAAPIAFTTRVGPVDYAHPYATAGVAFLPDGRIKLSLIRGIGGKWYSAGLLGPQVEEGTYTFTVHVPLGYVDPWAIFSIWFYSEDGKELDVFETDAAGNPNTTDRLTQTVWSATKEDGTRDKNRNAMDPRRFVRYRFTVKITADTFAILVEGDRRGEWITLGDWWTGALPGHVGQLRAGFYVQKGPANPEGKRYFDTVPDCGPVSVVIESVTFEPP